MACGSEDFPGKTEASRPNVAIRLDLTLPLFFQVVSVDRSQS